MAFRKKYHLVTNVLCLGAFQDDFDENGKLWLQCTSESCAKWVHQYCLRDVYVGGYAGTYFVRIRILYVMHFNIMHNVMAECNDHGDSIIMNVHYQITLHNICSQ